MKEIKLTQGFVTKVDDEDYDRLNQFKWCVHKCHKSYYAVRNARNSEGKFITIQMHRVILGFDMSIQIDHMDNDGLNNQKANLRKCTHSQNNANRPKHKGRSKYKGVHFIGKYIAARISVNKKEINLGMADSEIEAAIKYDIAAKKYYGEFANTNF